MNLSNAIFLSAALLLVGFGSRSPILAATTATAEPSPGQRDQTFRASVNGSVYAIATQPDGAIIIAGDFTSVQGSPRHHVAKLAADGSLHPDFVDAGLDGTALSLAIQPDGRVVVGGRFERVRGQSRAGIARLNPDGSLDTSFSAELINGARPPTIGCIVLQEDGRILIGGTFTGVGGQQRHGLARLETNGALDPTFNPAEVGGSVYTILLQPDGGVLVGGSLRQHHNSRTTLLVRLNSDGSADTSFQEITSLSFGPTLPVVATVAMQKDGKIVIGGEFAEINGETRRHIARLLSDGTLDATFTAGVSGAGSVIRSIKLQPDDRILVGGIFEKVNEEPRRNLVRLRPEGVQDDTFVPDSVATDRIIYAVVLQPDWDILLGGRPSIARLHGGPVPPDAYARWSETLPEGERSPTDDPGGHGIPNLLRYAFGMDPLTPERERLPGVSEIVQTIDGQEQRFLILTYTRRTDDSSLTYIAEGSGDLVGWLQFDGIEETSDDGNGETESVTLIDAEPISKQTTRFLRVRVER